MYANNKQLTKQEKKYTISNRYGWAHRSFASWTNDEIVQTIIIALVYTVYTRTKQSTNLDLKFMICMTFGR